MKPREFWLIKGDEYEYVGNSTKLDIAASVKQIHVREVVEITDMELYEATEANKAFIKTLPKSEKIRVRQSFCAGARWAIAKLTGAGS